MAANEKIKINVAEIQDLSEELQELAIGKQDVFYKYQPKSYPGKKIFGELMKKYKSSKKGFTFSDDFPESGILSLCQGLLSLISTVEKLDAPLEGSEKEFGDMIEELIRRTKKADGTYRIDASPYVPESEIFNAYVYLDAATWIVSTILGIIRLDINNIYKLSKEQEKELIAIYAYCIETICESYIGSIDDTSSKTSFSCGWNFAKGCEEPSVYFTFAVSEILIDILSTFENVIRSADVALLKKDILQKIDKDGIHESQKYLENKDAIEAALAAAADTDQALIGFDEFNDVEKRIIIEVWQKFRAVEDECKDYTDKFNSGSKNIKREKEFFDLLNKNKAPYDDGSIYSELEEKCKMSARNIWDLTSENLSTSFFDSTLKSIVSEQAIESSVSSDAIFNSIMIINIIINSGLDEDSEDKINYFTVNGSEEYNTAISEYDDMRDTLRLAYDKCYQFYLAMQKKRKDYKVNEYTLTFSESFKNNHAEAVNDLRRAHIRIFSLVPMMVRTKTTMMEFLIRYPQYDMQIFLEQILKHRLQDKDKSGDNKISYKWLWEKDGYTASGNYYFISSLASFYDYYREYEEKFIANANKNRQAREEIEKKYLESLKNSGFAADKKNTDFEELEQKLSKLEKEVAKEKEELDRRISAYEAEIAARDEKIEGLEKDPLRSFAGFIESVIKEKIVEILADKLSAEARRIVLSKKESIEKRAEDYLSQTGEKISELEQWVDVPAPHTGFEKGMEDILLAMLAEPLGEDIYSISPTEDKCEKEFKRFTDFEKYKKYTGNDVRQAARLYLRRLSQQPQSDFVVNMGDSTLPDGDNRYLREIIDREKKTQGDK